MLRFSFNAMRISLLLLAMLNVIMAANANPVECKADCTLTVDPKTFTICHGDDDRLKFKIVASSANKEAVKFTTKITVASGGIDLDLTSTSYEDTLDPGDTAEHAPVMTVAFDSPRGTATVTIKVSAKCMTDKEDTVTVTTPDGFGAIEGVTSPGTICAGGFGVGMVKLKNTGTCIETYKMTMAPGPHLVAPIGNGYVVELEPGKEVFFPYVVLAVQHALIPNFPAQTNAVFNAKIISANQTVPDFTESNISIQNCNQDPPDPMEGPTGSQLEPPRSNGKVQVSLSRGSSPSVVDADVVFGGQHLTSGDRVTLHVTVPADYGKNPDPNGEQIPDGGKFKVTYQASTVTSFERAWGRGYKANGGHLIIDASSAMPGDSDSFGNLRSGGRVEFVSPVYPIAAGVRGTFPTLSPTAITVDLEPDEYGRFASSATVSINVASLEYDLDVDNNNGMTVTNTGGQAFELPDGSVAEREELYWGQWSSFSGPGASFKMARINDGDIDEDGIPDFADGFDYMADGESQSEAGASANFVPMRVRLLGSLPRHYLGSLKICPVYTFAKPEAINGSLFNPEPGVVFTGDPVVRQFSQYLNGIRLWTKDGPKPRTLASDLIRSNDEGRPFAELGITGPGSESVWYIEPVTSGSGITLTVKGMSQDSGAITAFSPWSGIQAVSLRCPTIEIASGEDQSLVAFDIMMGLKGLYLSYFRPEYHPDYHYRVYGISRRPDLTNGWKFDFSKCSKFIFPYEADASDLFFYNWDVSYLRKRNPAAQVGADLYGFDVNLCYFGGYIPERPTPEITKPIETSFDLVMPHLTGLVPEGRLPIRVVIKPMKSYIKKVGATADHVPAAPKGVNSLLGQRELGLMLPSEYLDADLFYMGEIDAQNKLMPALIDGVSSGQHKFFVNRDDVFYESGVPGFPAFRNGAVHLPIQAQGPGVDVLEISALIGTGNSARKVAVHKAVIETLPPTIWEPDLSQLQEAKKNVAFYRALSPGWEGLGEAETPLPGNSNYRPPTWPHGPLPKSGELLGAMAQRDAFVFSQITESFEGQGDAVVYSAFGPFRATPEARLGDGSFASHELSEGQINSILSPMGGINGALDKNHGPAVSLWFRYYNAHQWDTLDLVKKARAIGVAMRAKHYLYSMAKSCLKLGLTMTKNQDQLGTGYWTDFDTIGGTDTLRGPGFWETSLHYGSPIKTLFESLNPNWPIGHPMTEEALLHMIAERFDLAEHVYAKIVQITGGPGSDDWPLVFVQGGVGFADLPETLKATMSPEDGTLNYTFSIAQLHTAQFAAPETPVLMPTNDMGLAFPTIPKLQATYALASGMSNPACQLNKYPTSIPGETYQYRNYVLRFNYKFSAGTQSLAAGYGEMLEKCIHEIVYLNLMLGDPYTKAWWEEYKTKQPFGFGLFVAGDALFGVHDIINLKGSDFATGQTISGTEYALTAASVGVNVIPGSIFLRAGRYTKAALAKANHITRQAAINCGLATRPPIFVKAVDDLATTEETNILSPAEQWFRVSREAPVSQQLLRLGLSGVKNATKPFSSSELSASIPDLLELIKPRADGGSGAVFVGGAQFPEIAGRGIDVEAKILSRSLRDLVDDAGASIPGAIAKDTKEFLQLTKLMPEMEGRILSGQTGVKVAEECIKGFCFPAGTQVLMADNTWKAIERVAVGDRVWCRDDQRPVSSNVTGVVTLTTNRLATSFVTLRYVTDHYTSKSGPTLSLRVTGEHPFWVDQKGWTAAEDLKVNDRILAERGFVTISGVDTSDLGKHENAYNFEVAKYHTYIVRQGDTHLGIVAHNYCEQLKQWIKHIADNFVVTPAKLRRGQRMVKKDGLKCPSGDLGDGPDAGNPKELRKSLGMTDGEGNWAHHINPSEVVQEHRLFTGVGLKATHNGVEVELPPMPFKTNDRYNGIPLPESSVVAASKTPPVPHHHAYHGNYSRAMEYHYDEIAAKVVAEYEAHGDVLAAVMLRDKLVDELTQKARKLLAGTGPENAFKKALPLYAAKSPYEKPKGRLRQMWIDALKTGIRP